ncbi:MAG: TonB-dependent receptor, partial [Steroidobacteraceae bacterium]|nr:TonB-dependent receptor [Steroidobacteraceae bacterium]MDW8258152.1 TonB-dependent receptor [Gammaproteobacteria bacterium]
GLFAFDEDQEFRFWVDQGFLFNQTGVQMSDHSDKTQAVFGQLTYSVSDRLRLTGGLRYTKEEKEVDGQIFNRQGAPCALLGATPVTIATIAAAIPWAATNEAGVAYPFPYCRDIIRGSRDWDDTSWKAGLEFDVNENSLFYANVSRGFKAGGYFAAGNGAAVGNTYEPEELVALAIGSKNRLANGRMRFNAEAFWWDYRDHQESYLAPTNPPTPAFGLITINVPKARIYGLDVEFEAALTDADNVSLRAQYLKAEYRDFVYRTSRPGEFATNSPGSQPPPTVCPATFISIGLYQVNCNGQEMPRSPELSIQAEYQHIFRLGNGATIVPSIALQYSADYWTAIDYNPLQRQDSYTMVDADVTFRSANERWTFSVWGRNLGDEDVWQNAFSHPSGVSFNALRPPRTYGARVSFNF